MSRDPYRSSAGDLGFGSRGGGRGGERWDSERFAIERDRARFEEQFEEREPSRLAPRGGGFGRPRERSVDELYERRGPRGLEEDRYERREYYDDEPRHAREPVRERERERDRGPSITIEKQREYYSPSPPRRAPARPAFLRRQSSLDTFDRKPLVRFEREEYGPPARYREDVRPPPLTPIPLPKTRALPPPRRYAEREYYDEIKVAEPDFYGDDDFRGYPERVREREIIRRRRRSRSRESRRSSVKGSVRSSSRGSETASSSGTETVRSEFPKKGKTRMPARLVSKRAIIDLGYPFEEEGEIIIIQKALGRENIDEVIKLSEDYKAAEKAEMSGGRSEAGTVIEERRQEVFMVPPPPPPPGWIPPPPPQNLEVITDTKIVEHHRSPSPARSYVSHHHHGGPVIIDAGRPREETFVEKRTEVYEQRSDPIPIGALALAAPRPRSTSAIRAEIKALEAEKEALRAEKRAEKEIRRAERIRREGRQSEGDLVLYDRERIEYPGEEVTLVRRERVTEPEGGVRIEKDKKGRMSISVPKYAR